MKKTLLLAALFLLTGGAAIAQCGEFKEKKDSFTGKKERNAQVIIGNLMTRWSVDVTESEGVATMKWGIAMQGEYNQKFDKGTMLLLKLEDGNILKLPTTETSSPVTKVLNGGAGTVNIFTTYYLNFDLDKETIAALAKSAISDIKVDVKDQEIKNPKIKDKQMGKVQDIFRCLNKS